MKREPMFLYACAIALIIYLTWNPGLLAGMRHQAEPAVTGTPAVEYPLNLRCIVTVDPLAASKPEIAGRANKVTGFVAPDTAEGILVRIDSEWLVLRDGCNENWIPMRKVLMIHTCQ
jgi:hypothetical protein